MKTLFRAFALLGLLAIVGCDANPGGPSAEGAKNETGESNTLAEGTKAPAVGNKKEGAAVSPPVSSPD